MGGLSFAAPWLLAAAALLPALYFILRQSPPPPRTVRLPSLKLVGSADLPPPQAHRPPWWLLALRLLIAALLLAALAGPRWQPQPLTDAPARLAMIIENGWTSAPRWPEMVDAAEERIDALAEAGTLFAVIPTAAVAADDAPAGAADRQGPPRFVDADTARAIVSALTPQPWGLDRVAAAARMPDDAEQALWIADGFESEGAEALRQRLLGAEIIAFPSIQPAFATTGRTATGWAARLVRPDGSPEEVRVEARGGTGEVLAYDTAYFDGSGGSVRLAVPPQQRAAVVRLSAGEGAAATVLVDDSEERPRVVVVGGGDNDAPLESGTFYIRRALGPHAEVARASLADAAADEADLFFLDDVAADAEAAAPLLERVREGAVVVSFAGPRIAENDSALSPVALRTGARAFGGTLSWQEPQRVAAFAKGSPLAGLPTPEDATVSKQLLAAGGEDDGAGGAAVWAALADGTPLVTARREGEGLLILVHSSADPGWSDLPLSGLFEAMLRRFLPLGANPAALDIAAEAPWRLERALGWRGGLHTPAGVHDIPAAAWESASASPQTPPGIYRSGDVRRALNLTSAISAGFRFEPLAQDGLRPAGRTAPPVEFAPWLLLAAALLLAADILVALRLRGMRLLPRPRSAAAASSPLGAASAAAAVAALCLLALPAAAQGQADDALTSGRLQLAYIGGTAADAEIERGLAGLSEALRRRTAVHPGPPASVTPGAEDIGRYPLIYWPAYARQRMSAEEAPNIRAYLARGGLILFDFGRPLGAGNSARELLLPLGLPPLAEADGDHVLFKSYYLLDGVGGGALWLEAGTEGDSGRVSGVAIGGGNWPALWSGSAAAPPSRREAALRFGINLAIYALTGTYKADQVHTETLLGRLGRQRRGGE